MRSVGEVTSRRNPAPVPSPCPRSSQKLGFSIAFTYGEPPFYGQVFRDGARLNLRQVDAPVVDAIRRATEQLLTGRFF